MGWKLASAMGASGVALGAFGAHGLRQVVADPHLLEVWDTAARYHLLHAVALLALASGGGRGVWAPRLFTLGIAIFSGSLYLMALTDARWLGAVTPLGGLALIAGWVAVGLGGQGRC
jgi:uncharacterized membrane protein YgdD (TMEM256/DUF423 family)